MLQDSYSSAVPQTTSHRNRGTSTTDFFPYLHEDSRVVAVRDMLADHRRLLFWEFWETWISNDGANQDSDSDYHVRHKVSDDAVGYRICRSDVAPFLQNENESVGDHVCHHHRNGCSYGDACLFCSSLFCLSCASCLCLLSSHRPSIASLSSVGDLTRSLAKLLVPAASSQEADLRVSLKRCHEQYWHSVLQ